MWARAPSPSPSVPVSRSGGRRCEACARLRLREPAPYLRAQTGDVAAIEQMLLEGAALRRRDKTKSTALHVACGAPPFHGSAAGTGEARAFAPRCAESPHLPARLTSPCARARAERGQLPATKALVDAFYDEDIAVDVTNDAEGGVWEDCPALRDQAEAILSPTLQPPTRPSTFKVKQ